MTLAMIISALYQLALSDPDSFDRHQFKEQGAYVYMCSDIPDGMPWSKELVRLCSEYDKLQR